MLSASLPLAHGHSWNAFSVRQYAETDRLLGGIHAWRRGCGAQVNEDKSSALAFPAFGQFVPVQLTCPSPCCTFDWSVNAVLIKIRGAAKAAGV
jgi:hypothetical protein